MNVAFVNMLNITETIPNNLKSRGGRISSAVYRTSQQQAQNFTGLNRQVNRYDLLLLVKRVGKSAGFTPRMIHLLDYYMSFTRDIDWEEGNNPIIYQSLSKTALDMGVTERQIQKLEKSLFEIGALTWHDSGNHRRYGKRDDKTGRILYAYGVNLAPLVSLKETLEDKLHDKQLYDQAWMETKRQISWYRGQIKGLINEIVVSSAQTEEGTKTLAHANKAYKDISIQIRTHLKLENLRTLLQEHKKLYEEILVFLDNEKTPKSSAKSEKKITQYNSTIKKQSDKSDTSRTTSRSLQKRNAEPLSLKKEPSFKKDRTDKPKLDNHGLEFLNIRQILLAMSLNFRAFIPEKSENVTWNDFIEAAFLVKDNLEIGQTHWAKACHTLGRSGAALCVLLTDHAMNRKQDPIRCPAAYFNAMVQRGDSGDLRLHNSIFGILDKGV